MERVSFEDQVVIVTGGGRGLGRAYCLELAARGASVLVNDILEDSADQVAAEVRQAGGKAVASRASVATPEGGREIVESALEAFGTVDALINNAGILRNNLFEDLTVEQIDAVFDVNLRGTFFVTQPAWRIMKEKGYGRVLLTGLGRRAVRTGGVGELLGDQGRDVRDLQGPVVRGRGSRDQGQHAPAPGELRHHL